MTAVKSVEPERFEPLRRNALSLLEILLVLMLLAILFALTIPRLTGFTLRNELTSAAQQVQSTLTQARNEAMRSGIPMAVMYQPLSGLYGWATMPMDQATTQSFQTTQSILIQSAALEQTQLRAADLGGESTTRNIKRLPGDVMFVDCSRQNAANDTRNVPSMASSGTANFPAGAGDTTAAMALPAIVFQPDGTATDSLLVLSNVDGEQIAILVRGLTGVTKTSEVSSGQHPYVAGGYSP